MSDHHDVDTRHWLDRSSNVSKLLWVLYGVGFLLFVVDAFYDKHAKFSFENFFGFYAIVGFVVFVAIVLTGKYLRKFLMRAEDYYDRDYNDD
jgi:hypothetical protein